MTEKGAHDMLECVLIDLDVNENTSVNATKEELINTEKNINNTIVENEEILAFAIAKLYDKIKSIEQRIAVLEESIQNI